VEEEVLCGARGILLLPAKAQKYPGREKKVRGKRYGSRFCRDSVLSKLPIANTNGYKNQGPMTLLALRHLGPGSFARKMVIITPARHIP
jgi:hypothetical protein